MKIFEYILIFIIALSSCNDPKQTRSEKDGDVVYTVADDDEEMNNAIKNAKKTLSEFDAALKSNNSNYEFFALKTKFITADGGEHIWVSDITLKENTYFGVIDNLPLSTAEVKIGDTIKIDRNNISDWMYIDKNKLAGGYTIRLLRHRMKDEERKQFDEEFGFIISD